MPRLNYKSGSRRTNRGSGVQYEVLPSVKVRYDPYKERDLVSRPKKKRKGANRKLTDDQVREVRKQWKSTCFGYWIFCEVWGHALNVSKYTINNILQGYNYTGVKDEI